MTNLQGLEVLSEISSPFIRVMTISIKSIKNQVSNGKHCLTIQKIQEETNDLQSGGTGHPKGGMIILNKNVMLVKEGVCKYGNSYVLLPIT